MKLYVIILSLLLQGCWWVPCVQASDAGLQWDDAIESAKGGGYDFAFMQFKAVLDEYPQSRWARPAEFTLGEYYFSQNIFPMAAEAFKDFYAQYPQHQEALIALAYLFQIAKTEGSPGAMKAYREKIASFRQLTFIFNDKRSFNYLSGFQHRYRVVYTINKVDVYVNGNLFTEIPF